MIDFSKFELDHVAIAVESIETSLPFYQALGFSSHHIEDVPSEKVRTCFLSLANNVSVELLEAVGDESPITKFLQKRGPGIHHMCYRVKNIEAVVAQVKKAGIQLINETPRQGAHNCKVVFVHPKSSGGVLIEFSEKMSDS
ncbi:MAG: methylmalonyl-CoA epimerase [Bdellovibrionales bacterium]|nr:methylmalonyl-CoA epimerase [Bdellovibrionales bacterium]